MSKLKQAAEAGDIAAPEGKKAGKGKKPALVANTLSRAGHNSGAIPELVALLDEFLALDEKIKALGKAKRDIRNKVKGEYSVLSFNWNEEIRMRKLQSDVRIQYESGRKDLQNMLGYQASLDLKEGTVARTEEEFADPSNKLTADALQRNG